MNKVIETIKKRRSIRHYIEKEIPEEILRDIVDCGRLAPTGYNNQPWSFVVVTDKNIREQVADAAGSGDFIREAGACVAVFCDKNAETALEDASAATENMMIAAEAYNLGTCWVNSYKKGHTDEVEQILNCPENKELMTLFAVGYYENNNKDVSKKSLSEVMKWQTF
ncbi:MAG: nitroreductase family protein [Halanaerobiaceae bacterium]